MFIRKRYTVCPLNTPGLYRGYPQRNVQWFRDGRLRLEPRRRRGLICSGGGGNTPRFLRGRRASGHGRPRGQGRPTPRTRSRRRGALATVTFESRFMPRPARQGAAAGGTDAARGRREMGREVRPTTISAFRQKAAGRERGTSSPTAGRAIEGWRGSAARHGCRVGSSEAWMPDVRHGPTLDLVRVSAAHGRAAFLWAPWMARSERIERPGFIWLLVGACSVAGVFWVVVSVVSSSFYRGFLVALLGHDLDLIWVSVGFEIGGSCSSVVS